MRLGRRRTAARYLRALATLETLIVHGHYEDARRLVDGIDPEEARSVASELEHPNRSRETEPAALRLLSAPGLSRRRVW